MIARGGGAGEGEGTTGGGGGGGGGCGEPYTALYQLKKSFCIVLLVFLISVCRVSISDLIC